MLHKEKETEAWSEPLLNLMGWDVEKNKWVCRLLCDLFGMHELCLTNAYKKHRPAQWNR